VQITISKRTARFAVVGLVVLLGIAYPAVTFAATGSNAPPSTVNTCTNIKNGLYGKIKVSASPVCPAGEFAQTWNQPAPAGSYRWSQTMNAGPLGQDTATGTTSFPAGFTVTLVTGSITGGFVGCATGGAIAGLFVGGEAVASWNEIGLPGVVRAPPTATSAVTLASSSTVTMRIDCGGDHGYFVGGQPSFDVTFSVTPPTALPYR
jgi:hypothetical protein